LVNESLVPREGDERLSDSKSKDAAAKRPRRSAKASNDVGRALKTVYDSTLAEKVPDDFLDLLGKLG